MDSAISMALPQRAQLAGHITIGATSVFLWDMLYNLFQDYEIIRTYGIDKSTLVYFISRYSTFAHLLTETLNITILRNHCGPLKTSAMATYVAYIIATLMLSYIRVCVVWSWSPKIVWVFGFLWIISCAANCLIISGTGVTLLPPNICVTLVTHEYLGLAIISSTLNHIMVFIAISVGLCRDHAYPQFRRSARVYIFGDSLPPVSKALLQTSQLCYFVTVLTGIMTVAWFYGYRDDDSFRLAMFPVYAVIINVMFSWVFRKAKLGLFTFLPPPPPLPPPGPEKSSSMVNMRMARKIHLDHPVELSSSPFTFRSSKVVDDRQGGLDHIDRQETSSFEDNHNEGAFSVAHTDGKGSPIMITVAQSVERRGHKDSDSVV